MCIRDSYHMVLGLLSPTGGAGPIVWVGSGLFTKAMTSYLYGSARAVTLAVHHTLAGPSFFRENVDLASVRAAIAAFAANEKLAPLDRTRLTLDAPRTGRESRLRRLGRALTLHGFLLPDALIRDRITVQSKGFHGKASAVFRYRRVLYEHPQSGQGFIAEYDRRRFFAELRDFLRAWLTLLMRISELRAVYRAGAAELGSETFWRSVYADVLPATPTPRDTRAAAPAGAGDEGAREPEELAQHVRTPAA